MSLNGKISDKKLELMGEAAALLFKLKMTRDGCYSLRAGQKVSKLGMGNTILTLISETCEHTEQELEEFVKQRRIKA